MCVYVWLCVCGYLRERDRKRERESVCVYVCLIVCFNQCVFFVSVCMSMCVHESTFAYVCLSYAIDCTRRVTCLCIYIYI
jgi:hypothetical protein